MKTIQTTIFSLILLLGLSQCQKELSGNIEVNTITIKEGPNPITSGVQGLILDENGGALQHAKVTIGMASVTTNAKGFFVMRNITMDELQTVATAEKAGYFKGVRTFAAGKGLNKIVIQLTRKVLAGSIDMQSGGTVTLINNSQVSLPVNSVVNKQTDMSYGGRVNVYAAYIDPSSQDIINALPGSFAARDKNGKAVALASFGMLAVELESTSGESLQIAPGKKASIKIAIPQSLAATSTASIPLWYLNETNGLWQEDGTATKTGNFYSGEVSHFTYWNCDFPGERVFVHGRMVFDNGNIAANIPVKFSTQATPVFNSYGYTDSAGYFGGFVPANLPLNFATYTTNCYQYILLRTLPALSTHTDLGTFTISSAANNAFTIKGKLINCSGEPVTNGYAEFNSAYNNYLHSLVQTDAEGNFSFSFLRCDTAGISLVGVDNSTNLQSAVQILHLQPGIFNAGNISVCGANATQFFNYKIDGVDYSATDSLQAYRSQLDSNAFFTHYIQSANVSQNHRMWLSFKSPVTGGTGTYALVSFQMLNNSVWWNATIPANLVLTNMPAAAGDFYEGNYSGQFLEPSNNTQHQITMGFRIRRTQ